MISLCMIITALVPGLALAKVSMECNLHVSGPTGPQQCFGILGEPLMFHLPTNLKKIMLKKNEKLNILNTVNAAVVPNEKYINRSVFFSNGTFKLNNAQKTDSGNYKLQTFGPKGQLLDDINMHLEIQAAVSKPVVSQMCLSPEQMNISCSAEGDRAEFILTLDGLLLMQTRGNSQSPSSSTIDTLSLAGSTDQHKSSVTITLYGQLRGNLMCNVQNNVSREETIIHLTNCKGSISHFSLVAVAVIASAVTLLLHVALFVGFKHLNKKTRSVTVVEDNAEDEIVYSDVRVMKHIRKTRPTSEQNPS